MLSLPCCEAVMIAKSQVSGLQHTIGCGPNRGTPNSYCIPDLYLGTVSRLYSEGAVSILKNET